MALSTTLRTLFDRDLEKLIKELNAYSDEKKMWIIDKSIANSAGNLALHLVGNLNTFIGAAIGDTGYVRQRELEFSLKDVPRLTLIAMIKETQDVVDEALSNMDPVLLDKEYPILVFKEPQTYQHFLVHLTVHLGFHLGQVNYHRRLLDN